MHQSAPEVNFDLPTEQDSAPQPWNVWLEIVQENTSSKNPVVTAVADEFLPRLKTAAPEIYAGQQGLSLDEDGSDRVLEELEKWCNEKQRRIIQHVFRCGLERGNLENRWLIALPPLRLPVERPVNPVRPREFALLHPLANIESRFFAELPNLLKAEVSIVAGALLFVAARWCGLVQKDRQAALLKISAQNVFLEGGVLRITLEDGSTWFPTPFCETFLHAALRKKALPQTISPQQALKTLATELELSAEHSSLLQNRLPALCKAKLAQVLPGYLLGSIYQVNKFTGLPSSAWSAILSGQRRPDATIALKGPEYKPELPVYPDERPKNADEIEANMVALGRILQSLAKPATHVSSVMAIEQIREWQKRQNWPIQKSIADYVVSRIERSVKDRKGFSTSLRYFHSLWRPMLEAFVDLDPHEMDESSLCDAIDAALLVPRSALSRAYLQKVIADWLRQADLKVDFAELDNWNNDGKASVHADVITPAEFDLLIFALRTGKYAKETWLQDVCVHVARLCYRAGLRRREPLVCRLQDLQPSRTPELILRHSEFGRLKSEQGERRIPIQGVLLADEATELLAYRKTRWLTALPRDPLFVDPENPAEPLDSDRVFRHIAKALRDVTGNTRATVHLLRHSAANVALLRMHVADNSLQFPASIHAFQHDIFQEKQCKAFKAALFGLPPERLMDAGTRNLYALAVFMGHLSPATTLQSYLHIQDLLIMLFAQQKDPQIQDYAVLAAAMGLGLSRYYQLLDEWNIPRKEASLTNLLPYLRAKSLK